MNFLRSIVLLFVFSVFLFVSIFFGCTKNTETNNQVNNGEDCPDPSITTFSCIISSDLDEGRNILDTSVILSKDAKKIDAHIRLSNDICCTALNVHWIYQDEIIHKWKDTGTMDRLYFISSLDSSGNDFPIGEYKIIIFS